MVNATFDAMAAAETRLKRSANGREVGPTVPTQLRQIAVVAVLITALRVESFSVTRCICGEVTPGWDRTPGFFSTAETEEPWPFLL